MRFFIRNETKQALGVDYPNRYYSLFMEITMIFALYKKAI